MAFGLAAKRSEFIAVNVSKKRRVGAALIGVGGAVGSTVTAATVLLQREYVDTSGLPLASRRLPDAVAYDCLVAAGWDLNPQRLDAAVERNDIIDHRLRHQISDELSSIKPWPAAHTAAFCRPLIGENILPAESFRSAIQEIVETLDDFRRQNGLDEIVVVNLASTERMPDLTKPCFESLSAFESAIDANDPSISASMLYAYAAIVAGYPFANFTPSCASDIQPIEQLAADRGIPIAGKDGKTGQTFVKTVLAPALRDRALRVDGWYSTNLLGNLDGFVLDDEGARASKIATKRSVLDSILGYPVESHGVDIVYHSPKGDRKEAWDSIDVSGFLGQKMQIKINFLCADSILAAPLVIELVRLLDLAKSKGEKGALKPLSAFFKSPQGFRRQEIVHDFSRQQVMLNGWLANFES